MTNSTIRRATFDDAAAIAGVYVASARLAERGHIPAAVLDAMQPGEYVESWERRIGSPRPHKTWVAELGGEIVGVAYVEPSPDADATSETGHLDMLYVLPAHAGAGIGARLLAVAVEHLAASGFTEATLWALAGNDRTRRFYEREGWQATGEAARHDEDGYAVDLVRYARPLTPPEPWPRIELRPATAEDVRAVTQLHVLVGQVSFRGLVPDELLMAASIENRIDRWRTRITDPEPGAVTWLATVDGAIVGLCYVHPSHDADVDPLTGEVQAIFVRPDMSGLGIGSRLLETGLRSLKEFGCTNAKLYVLESNEQAQQFYRKHGWMPDGLFTDDEVSGTIVRELRFGRSLVD